MPTTKSGEQISTKEFFRRWKQGISNVTALQQVSMQLKSLYIIMFGLIAGIIVCIFNIKSAWWLLIILVGGLFNSVVQWIGIYQKKIILEGLE